MDIVLTGSSSGIGRALSHHLLDQGHRVWGIARSDQSDTVATQVGFRFSRVDVSDYGTVEKVAADVSTAWSNVDVLIACAGLQGEIGRTLDSDPTRWAATIRSNLEGTYNTLRAFAPLMLSAPRRAKIICFSGGGATKARANFSAYGAAKTGIVRLVETIAEEERERPLDINAIAPGALNTRLTDEVLALGPVIVGEQEYTAAQKQKLTGGVPLEKVFSLVDWLISPTSDGVSGRLLSAPWDPWASLATHRDELSKSDVYTLRRILPEDRGLLWS